MDVQLDREDSIGSIPPPRWAHTLNSIKAQNREGLFLFGGSGTRTYNDCFLYVLASKSWLKVDAAGNVPAARLGHSAVTITDSTLCIFGGRSANKNFNDMYIFYADKLSFEKLAHKKPWPESRSGHSCVMFKKHLIMFGGTGSRQKYFSDLWIFDIEKRSWKKMDLQGTCPSPRGGHAACVGTSSDESHRFYISGGFNGSSYFNDIWSIDLAAVVNGSSTAAWQKENVSFGDDCTWTARSGHSMTSIGTQLMFIAGCDCFASFSNQSYTFDTMSGVMKRCVRTDNQQFNPRFRHATCLVGNTIYMFGGTGPGVLFNDMFSFTVSFVSESSPSRPAAVKKLSAEQSSEASETISELKAAMLNAEEALLNAEKKNAKLNASVKKHVLSKKSLQSEVEMLTKELEKVSKSGSKKMPDSITGTTIKKLLSTVENYRLKVEELETQLQKEKQRKIEYKNVAKQMQVDFDRIQKEHESAQTDSMLTSLDEASLDKLSIEQLEQLEAKLVQYTTVVQKKKSNKLKSELEEMKSVNTCAVCKDAKIDLVLVPCGHRCVCMSCAASLKHCPICRCKITDKIRTY